MDKDQAALLNSWMTYAETALRLLRGTTNGGPTIKRLDEIFPWMVETRDQWKALAGLQSRIDPLMRPWRLEDTDYPHAARILDSADKPVGLKIWDRPWAEAIVAAINAEYEREKSCGS